jgi:hypothetical protein
LPAWLPPTDDAKSFSTVSVLTSGEKVPFDVPNGLPSWLRELVSVHLAEAAEDDRHPRHLPGAS